MTDNHINMTHVIDNINSKKPGYFNPIHSEVSGRPCRFLDIKLGERGWIGYEPYDEPGSMHRLHTSIIKSIECEDGDEIGMNGSVVLETEYTFYHFIPIDKYINNKQTDK